MAEGADKEKENGQEEVGMGNNNKGSHSHHNCSVESKNNSNGTTGLEKISISTSKSSQIKGIPSPSELATVTVTFTRTDDGESEISKSCKINQSQMNGNANGDAASNSMLNSNSKSQAIVNSSSVLTNGNGVENNRHGSPGAEYGRSYSLGTATEDSKNSDSKALDTAGDTSDCGGGGGGGDGDTSRRHLKSSSLPHGVKLCPETKDKSEKEGRPGSSNGVNGEEEEDEEVKSDKWAVLEEELRKAHSELKAKDAEVEKLKDIRTQVEGELTDLTAALFEEAHKMVQEAKMKEVSSEKSLKEAKMQLDGLQAEVAALKTLLITSTPSRPNLGGNGISIFKKQHKRCPSHNHLQYGRCEDDADGKEKRKQDKCTEVVVDRERCEVDPILHALFGSWRQEPTLTVNHNNNKSQFLQKIYTEDIDPCLSFSSDPLVRRLRQAVEENSIWVEPIPEKEKNNVPTECALVRCPRICHYRMRFAYDSDEWFDISQLCRDRIAAVCEFLNYLRYIKNGLVKASVDDAYWEIIRLRKQMALAKLGIPLS